MQTCVSHLESTTGEIVSFKKRIEPDMVAHTCHPRCWGVEARGSLSFMSLKTLSLGCMRHFF